MQSTDNTNDVIIEQGKHLSESLLWQLQRDYYHSSGINAWVNQIPFEVTCNPFIANAYAHIAIAFIRDYIAKHPDATAHPFYFLELGAGSGKFSFYVVKAILELLALAGMKQVKVCYIMSDITDNNIKYYRTHPGLKLYIDAGIIDFAIVELESGQPVKLLNSGEELSKQLLVNPLITFANYVFDTAAHDAFYIYEHQIQSLNVDIKTNSNNIDNGKIKSMQELEISFSTSDNDEYRYGDNTLDQILEHYRNNIYHSNILIPIGALKALAYLNSLSNNKMLLISTDKGNNSIESIDNLGPPGITFHASQCFSLMVNYHALALYFQQINGDAFLETTRDQALETGVFVSGFKLTELPELNLAIQEHIDEKSPCAYYKMNKHIIDTSKQCDLDTLASHLSLGHWDPTTFCLVWERIHALLPEANKDVIAFMTKNIHRIADNYYYMPKSDAVLFYVALFFHLTANYDAAINYYQQSQLFDSHLAEYIHFNLGLCFYNKNAAQQAVYHFNQVLNLNPESVDAKTMIELIENS